MTEFNVSARRRPVAGRAGTGAAASGGAITRNNVEDVQAKLIVEAANSPVTPRADDNLRQRGIHVIPDILTNGGGVTVPYSEWVQNLQQFHWDEQRVNAELERKMVAAWEAVFREHQATKVTMRIAAYAVALKRLAEATKMRF